MSDLPVASCRLDRESSADAPEQVSTDRTRLREQGWSNKAIADELGVHASTVGRWFTPPVKEPETTTEMETTP